MRDTQRSIRRFRDVVAILNIPTLKNWCFDGVFESAFIEIIRLNTNDFRSCLEKVFFVGVHVLCER